MANSEWRTLSGGRGFHALRRHIDPLCLLTIIHAGRRQRSGVAHDNFSVVGRRLFIAARANDPRILERLLL